MRARKRAGRAGLLGTLLCGTTAMAGAALAAPTGPENPAYLTPEDALAAFQLEPGLRIELVAAEPLVVDPIAFTFDENGRLYVVEARGYPDPIDGGAAGSEGRVALLEDTNGDGRYDRRHEFATGLGYPSGVAVWRGGVFVTAAPDLLYLEDTTGDGIADEQTVVLTGFDTSKTAQLRVSHPTLGWDGKFYVSSGRAGGAVSSPLHPGRAPTPFSTADGRFDPEDFQYESIGGQGQFGLTFDAFGRRFTSSNRDPLRHVVMEPWQLRRNPHLAASRVMQGVSKTGAEAKVHSISRATVTADFIPKFMSSPHAGTFTSACAPLIFGGTGLSPEHVGNAFICEPAQNLVQRQVLRRRGASFRSDPPYEGREFLASTDVWFRPVFLASGPDGALYVADMHRREIDHPQYVPEEMRDILDFDGGKGSTGRIYRIAGAAAKSASPKRAETTADLCRDLELPDAWWRDRARRLLLERRDVAAVPLLKNIAGRARLPESRAGALWILHAMGRLELSVLTAALGDRDVGVREQAVTLATRSFPDEPRLTEALLPMAHDPDARVRFVAALWLGSRDDPRAVDALAAVAMRDGEDEWARAAVLSGIGSRIDAFSRAVLRTTSGSAPARAAFMEDLGRVVGAGGSPEERRRFLLQLLAEGDGFGWRLGAVLGLAEGAGERAESRRRAANPIAEMLGPDGSLPVPPSLDDFLTRAEELAKDEGAAPRERANAVALLGHMDFVRVRDAISRLLDAGQETEIQLQAVRAIERLGDPRGARLLVQPRNWSRYTPQIREAVMAALLSRPAMIQVLFEAVRGGVIASAEISSLRRGQLQKHADAEIRASAEAIFENLEAGDRMQVYREYRHILGGSGDATRGAAVFDRACAACHTFGAAGGAVGPDLTGMRNQPAEALLLHILVPNYEVAPENQAVSITTSDGRSLFGSVAAETSASLTLRTAAGTEETVLRRNIRSLAASGLSLMPDGLEQAMTRDELAALISYLKSDMAAGR